MNTKLLLPALTIMGLTASGKGICDYFDNSSRVVTTVGYSLIPILAVLFVAIINEMREGWQRISSKYDDE